MAAPSQIMFKFSEIAEALVRQQDIHEGLWGIVVRFGITGTNTQGPSGGILPTALVPILEMGIQKFDEPNSLTVDAAEINPAKDNKRQKGK